jgi:hypothetical protein
MAPDKLVGVAFHDDQTSGRHASGQMRNVPFRCESEEGI